MRFCSLPSIFCDPLRSMVAPRERERMNSLHKLRQNFGGNLGSRATYVAHETVQAEDSHTAWLWKDAPGAKLPFVAWDERTSQGFAVTYESDTTATRRI
jgi:hypothetical protein